jgi:hypothetical protein
VVVWGDNYFSQTNVPAGLNDVRAIGVGTGHVVALKGNGTVVVWGRDDVGQTDIPAGLSHVKAISAGHVHTLALKGDGTVVAWLWSYNGQSEVPAGLRDVMAIAAGGFHSLALKRDGNLVGWGWNIYGQASVPAGLRSVVMAIAAGREYTVALKSSYSFSGFVGPVNASPIVNTLQAGAGVPVKFSLGGNKGLAIFASGYPVSRTVSCNPDAKADEIEWTVNAGRSRLRYDANTDTYTYVWKTALTWAGQCRKLSLRFADGIEHSAVFRFR